MADLAQHPLTGWENVMQLDVCRVGSSEGQSVRTALGSRAKPPLPVWDSLDRWISLPPPQVASCTLLLALAAGLGACGRTQPDAPSALPQGAKNLEGALNGNGEGKRTLSLGTPAALAIFSSPHLSQEALPSAPLARVPWRDNRACSRAAWLEALAGCSKSAREGGQAGTLMGNSKYSPVKAGAQWTEQAAQPQPKRWPAWP